MNKERSSRRRKLSDQTTEELIDPTKAPRLTEQIFLTTGTTLLYCRSGMISQAEVSQQSSIQSERTTGELPALVNSTCLPFEQTLFELFKQHFDEETNCKLVANLLDDEELGIWFNDVIDIIGINEEHRTACHQEAIISEILINFFKKFPHTQYFTGSSIEGTFAPGEKHDGDVVQCDETYPVFEKIVEPAPKRSSFLIIRELCTPVGYVKLQFEPSSLDENNKTEFIKQYCKTEDGNLGRSFLREIINMPYNPQLMYMTKNKPALKVKNFYGDSLDHNRAYRCTTWPTFAQEWISRDRLFGWPTKSMVHQLSLLGFFVVKKCHPLSQEKDLEWKLSFSLQERELMFSLTDVQHKCYTVLKMFNREMIESKCITSYHWKTCLFYVIEQNSGIIWKKEKLFVCIQICILQMLTWVKREYCPNYFIHQDNLFAGTLDKSQKFKLECKLKELLEDDYNCLLNLKAGKLYDFYRTRESLEDFKLLQSSSKNDLEKARYIKWRAKILHPLELFNHKILGEYYYEANEKEPFIKKLWNIITRIFNTDTIAEHTIEETKNALSYLLPHIYTCLASNIAAIAIQNTNIKVRDFLLLGSFTYFMKGTLSGKLKFISVLYALRFYEDCKWYIAQLDEDIQKAPSVCGCRLVINNELVDIQNITTKSNMTTCVSFLSSELPITPDALMYEMFKCFGIKVMKEERTQPSFQWNYRAVVDCNVYFVFLKFLIRIKRRPLEQFSYIYSEIEQLLERQQVRHRDVALNLMAWISTNIPATLHFLTLSWIFTYSLNVCHFLPTNEMKRKLCQFNAAKLHALVALYNTWCARNASSVKFCFHCYAASKQNFERCSNCKIARYCSIYYQTNNWKIHKAVCKIAKKNNNK